MESRIESAQSRVNNKYMIDEKQWLMSVINQPESNSLDQTTSLIFGHARLIIEGIKDGQIFVGDYDIRAEYEEPSNFISRFFSLNPTGRITEIGCYEDGYEHSGGEAYYEGSQSKSYPVLRCNAELAISSIKDDIIRTEEAKNGNGAFIAFQQLGSEGGPIQALLSDSNGGLNCAEWCIQKLRVAGINASGKPKPELVAGGCVIS